MEKQNVTLSLPKTLLQKAKLMAVRQDKSLSQLLVEALQEKIEEEAAYRKARERQLRLLETGLNLGTRGQLTVSREELHAR
jgi:metal-responsive CopG/Arc/MetJ family transcriptional regulator